MKTAPNRTFTKIHSVGDRAKENSKDPGTSRGFMERFSVVSLRWKVFHSRYYYYLEAFLPSSLFLQNFITPLRFERPLKIPFLMRPPSPTPFLMPLGSTNPPVLVTHIQKEMKYFPSFILMKSASSLFFLPFEKKGQGLFFSIFNASLFFGALPQTAA